MEENRKQQVGQFLDTFCYLVSERTKRMLEVENFSSRDDSDFFEEPNYQNFCDLLESNRYKKLDEISFNTLVKINQDDFSEEDSNFFHQEVEKISSYLKDEIIDEITAQEVQKKFLLDSNSVEKVSDLLKITEENKHLIGYGKAVIQEILLEEDLSKFDIGKVQAFLKIMLHKFQASPHELLKLSFLFSQENYLVSNSLNVCLMAINSSIGLGYSEDEVVKLGVSALLHDVGMQEIPERITHKNTRLTNEEKEILSKHPTEGIEKVMQIPGLDADIEQAIFQEHERMDGSGYPEKVKAKNIHEFAKIIAVSDTFESLSHSRPHRGKILPFYAMHRIGQMSRKTLDYGIVKNFINSFSAFPIGTVVELSSGEKAMVVESNQNSPFRPKVMVVFTKGWRKTTYQRFVDLKKEYLMQIVRSVSEEEFVKYL